MTRTLLLFLLIVIFAVSLLCTILFAIHEIQLSLVLPVEPVEHTNVAENVPRLARCRVRKRIQANGTGTAAGIVRIHWWKRNGEDG